MNTKKMMTQEKREAFFTAKRVMELKGGKPKSDF